MSRTVHRNYCFVYDLFEGDLTDDRLVCVNHVLKGNPLESDILVQQATHPPKKQFAHSPELSAERL